MTALRIQSILRRVFVTVALFALTGCYAPKWARSAPTLPQPTGPRLGERLERRWLLPLGTVGTKPGYVLGDSLYVYCANGLLIRIRRQGGGIVWRSNINYPLDVKPTRDGKGRLFAMSGGKLIILDEKSGELLARRRVNMGAIGGVWSTGKGVIFAGSDSCVHIINPRTGFDSITPQPINANVLSADSVSPSLLHMSLDDGTVVAYFANTGTEAWKASLSDRMPYAGIGLYDNSVYVGGADFYLYRFNAHTGFRAWRVPIGGVARQKPALSRGRVFLVTLIDSKLYAVRARDGRALWKEPITNCRRFLTADNDYVIFERDPKQIVVADAKTGKELGASHPLGYQFVRAHREDGFVFLVDYASNVECVAPKKPENASAK